MPSACLRPLPPAPSVAAAKLADCTHVMFSAPGTPAASSAACFRRSHSPRVQQRAMPVRLAPAAALAALLLILTIHKASAECKNCIALDKEGRSLLRAQWEACGAGAVGAEDGADLKRRAYCALRRCKLLAKDGKLRKAALTHLARGLPADQAKILERCSKQTGETPEDLAWNIFTCAFEHKSLLNLPPRAANAPGDGTSPLTA